MAEGKERRTRLPQAAQDILFVIDQMQPSTETRRIVIEQMQLEDGEERRDREKKRV